MTRLGLWLKQLPVEKGVTWLTYASLALAVITLAVIPFAMQMARPFALHDYLGDHLTSSHPDPNLRTFRSVVHNLRHDYLHNLWNFRPVTNLFYNSCYCLFGGEFWVFDLIKWGMKLLAVYWIWATLRAAAADKWAALCGASFFGFHITCFEAQTLAADAVLGFFALACVYLLARGPKPFDLDAAAWGRGKFLAFAAAYVLMLGSKEPGAAIACALLLALAVRSSWNLRGILRLGMLAALLALHSYLILRPAFAKLQQPQGTAGILTRLVQMLQFSFGTELNSAGFAVLAALLLLGTYLSLRRGAWHGLAVVALAFAAVTLFNAIPVSYPPFACPRYAIPGSMLLAILFGLALAQFGRAGRWVCTPFLIVYPFFTGETILQNHLCLLNLHKEAGAVVKLMINKSREGFEPYLLRAPDPEMRRGVWPEEFLSLQNFFGRFGQSFYRYFPVGTIKEWKGAGPHPEAFTLFTNEEYADLDPSLREEYEVTVYRFPFGHPGLLGKLVAGYHRTAKWLGRSDHIMIDRCAGPRFKVMALRRGPNPRHTEVPLIDVSFGSIAH